MLEFIQKYVSEKLNPAQPAIATIAGKLISPQNDIDFMSAYHDIEIVNRCVDIIVAACAEMTFIVESDSLRPPTDRIDKLLNRYPNPFIDRIEFFRRAYLDYFIDGNVFFYYDFNENKLYHLPARYVSIVPDEKTYVSKYIYNYGVTSGLFSRSVNDQSKKNIEYSPDEVIHIRSSSPFSEYRGDSKLQSAKRLIELYYSLIDFQKQFFKNNAVPGLVLQTDNVLSKPVKERLLEQWKVAYNSTFQSARSPAILDGGLRVEKLGSATLNELDFEASVDRVQQDIAKALGVPHTLLKSGNNANLDANEKVFYNHTILPIVGQFASAFQLFFFSGQSLDIYPDKEKVLVLQPDLKTQALYYSSLVNAGIITPDEAREAMRYKALGGEMSKIRVPQNITGSATRPDTGGRPSDGSKPKPKKPHPNNSSDPSSDKGK